VRADPAHVLDVSKLLQLIEAIPMLLVSDDALLQLQRLARLLLNEGDSATREAFFRLHLCSLQMNAHLVSSELQVGIFDVCVTSGTTAGTVAFSKEVLKRRILFERIANRAIEDPNEIIENFNGLVLSTAQFSEFLDELPVFSSEISVEFCSLLRKVLSHFPTSVYKPPARDPRVMSVTWNDSE
jgi:hypothetical protein